MGPYETAAALLQQHTRTVLKPHHARHIIWHLARSDLGQEGESMQIQLRSASCIARSAAANNTFITQDTTQMQQLNMSIMIIGLRQEPHVPPTSKQLFNSEPGRGSQFLGGEVHLEGVAKRLLA
eukprot:TRINITY_DN8754_c0_g1_i1.p1 TRINITY_DN8754_c0_g1~~TRINITY_DN8754_c0_g1_i1.p1  ORF type:complete len:124 (+),score=13.42 TRINITY_DN8754_c0_g1_i1:91-462(+)